MKEEYKPTPEEEAIFRETAQAMYDDARKNYNDNEGFGTHADVEKT